MIENSNMKIMLKKLTIICLYIFISSCDSQSPTIVYSELRSTHLEDISEFHRIITGNKLYFKSFGDYDSIYNQSRIDELIETMYGSIIKQTCWKRSDEYFLEKDKMVEYQKIGKLQNLLSLIVIGRMQNTINNDLTLVPILESNKSVLQVGDTFKGQIMLALQFSVDDYFLNIDGKDTMRRLEKQYHEHIIPVTKVYKERGLDTIDLRGEINLHGSAHHYIIQKYNTVK